MAAPKRAQRPRIPAIDLCMHVSAPRVPAMQRRESECAPRGSATCWMVTRSGTRHAKAAARQLFANARQREVEHRLLRRANATLGHARLRCVAVSARVWRRLSARRDF
jgi:hypothetical protein